MGFQDTPKPTQTKPCVLLSRRQIEGMIANGHAIFIVEQHVIKGDAWLKYHSGGDKSILHMVGRDATDEVTVYVGLYINLLIQDLSDFNLTSYNQLTLFRNQRKDDALSNRKNHWALEKLPATNSRWQISTDYRRSRG